MDLCFDKMISGAVIQRYMVTAWWIWIEILVNSKRPILHHVQELIPLTTLKLNFILKKKGFFHSHNLSSYMYTGFHLSTPFICSAIVRPCQVDQWRNTNNLAILHATITGPASIDYTWKSACYTLYLKLGVMSTWESSSVENAIH